jgi:HAD superfamily hydrolase (TIGR01549 family)
MSGDERRTPDTAVLDVDGTLVDSMYAHVWSWREALRHAGVSVPTWQIHRAIGMGGDRLVEEVTSSTVEASMGDEIRSRQAQEYAELSRHLSPTPGAAELLDLLRGRGLKVALASSGSRGDTTDSVALLGGDSVVDGWVCGDDVEGTKPDEEPLIAAVRKVHGEVAFMVGDSVWDIRAAREAGYRAVGLLCGGVAECELRAEGAVAVYRDPEDLASSLDDALAALSA